MKRSSVARVTRYRWVRRGRADPTWDNEGYYTVGLKRGDASARWHFVDGVAVTKALGPAVVIETDGTWTILDEYSMVGQFELLEEVRLYGPECVLVVPHTSATEAFFRHYLEWDAGGRPADPDDPRDLLRMTQIPRQIHWTTQLPCSSPRTWRSPHISRGGHGATQRTSRRPGHCSKLATTSRSGSGPGGEPDASPVLA